MYVFIVYTKPSLPSWLTQYCPETDFCPVVYLMSLLNANLDSLRCLS